MNKNWILDFVPVESEGPLSAREILEKTAEAGHSWKAKKIQSKSGSMTKAGVIKSFARYLRGFPSVKIVERNVGLRRLSTLYFKEVRP